VGGGCSERGGAKGISAGSWGEKVFFLFSFFYFLPFPLNLKHGFYGACHLQPARCRYLARPFGLAAFIITKADYFSSLQSLYESQNH